jgi:hypothetical protein
MVTMAVMVAPGLSLGVSASRIVPTVHRRIKRSLGWIDWSILPSVKVAPLSICSRILLGKITGVVLPMGWSWRMCSTAAIKSTGCLSSWALSSPKGFIEGSANSERESGIKSPGANRR